MLRCSQKLVLLLGVLVLLAVLAGPSAAQTVFVAPAPRVVYYSAPAVTYYPPPTVTYYAAPAVSYYSPPAVSYYSPPAVSYYSAPAVVPATTVTTYRYGILPRRQVTVSTYGTVPVVAPPPRVVRYRGPLYVY